MFQRSTRLGILTLSTILLVGANGLVAAADETGGETGSSKPNILLLLADDLGYGELGCYGQKEIKTPVLDDLAAQGMRFTDFYAGCSVCAPSRAVLMTGKSVGRVSVRGNHGLDENNEMVRVSLSKDEVTLAEMLKKAGYETGFVGKWHLGLPEDVSTWACSRGFDFAIQEQWGKRSDGYKFEPLKHWIDGDQKSVSYDTSKYECLDEFRTTLVMDFLDQRDKSKPFFLFMSYRAPHGHERNIQNKTLYADQGWTEMQRRHAAKITLLDREVGRLLKRLEADGELDNTLILFTSDNGPHREGRHTPNSFDSSGGLRGIKRDLYDGGIRVPLIAVWKGKIKPGTESDHIATFSDVMPTVAEAVGIEASAQTDGISFVPELTGKKQRAHEYLYWEILISRNGTFRQAIRKGLQKAVRYGLASKTQLYDLGQDIAEEMDLAAKFPQVIQEMNERFESSRTQSDEFPYGGKPTKKSRRAAAN